MLPPPLADDSPTLEEGEIELDFDDWLDEAALAGGQLVEEIAGLDGVTAALAFDLVNGDVLGSRGLAAPSVTSEASAAWRAAARCVETTSGELRELSFRTAEFIVMLCGAAGPNVRILVVADRQKTNDALLLMQVGALVRPVLGQAVDGGSSPTTMPAARK